jgi:hypothetical protein
MKKNSFKVLVASVAGLFFLANTRFESPLSKPDSFCEESFEYNSKRNTQPSKLTEGIAVVELFTSEGCSSCPPADIILSSYGNQDNVFPLGFHVTYWNRLGWRDSFSQKTFDKRQYDYSERFNLNGNYTPQIVVNGDIEMVGSRHNQVDKAIKEALKTPPSVKINLAKVVQEGDIQISYQLEGVLENAVLNLAIVENQLETTVLRGENGGKKLKHDHVVRDFQTIVLKKGEKEGKTLFFPLSHWKLSHCSIVAFVQNENNGPVRGASRLKIQ